MRPGECTAPTGDNTPSLMADIQFYIGNRRVSASATTTDDDLSQATYVTFTTKKNEYETKSWVLVLTAVETRAI
jgi:hypothetical protein